MNIKLILKTLFIIAILALLVIMGMYNPNYIDLHMPSNIPHSTLHWPAAFMYYAFFGVGFLSGTILMAGGKKGGGGSAGKPSKA